MKTGSTLTVRILLIFWLPLALMWIIMGVEQPALNAVMARLPDAARHLAGFEVAFGLALVIESPILQMLSAATALVRGRRSYRSLLRFMHALAAALTTAHVVLTRPMVFGWVARGLLSVPEDVIEPAREVLTILVPFAAMVGYRRLWQGGLIRSGRTKLVARTMVIRLAATMAGLATGQALHRIEGVAAPPGHIVGAGSLMLGVAAGAIAAWWYFRAEAYPELVGDDEIGVKSLPALLGFYVPLSLTSVMTLVSRPILAYGISRSVEPFLSLAAWPVVQSLLFLFTSISLSYQEAVVAKMSEHHANETILRRFGLGLGTGLILLYALLAFTPASTVWFERVAGLSPELAALARPAMMLMALMPMLVTGRSYFSGLLVSRDRTGLLGLSVIANTVTLLTLIMVLPRYTEMVGANVAAIAFTSANVSQFVVLWIGDARTRRRDRLAIRAETPKHRWASS